IEAKNGGLPGGSVFSILIPCHGRGRPTRNGAIHERDYPARNVTPGRRAASLVARCRDGYAQLAEHPAITPSLIEAKNGGLPEDSAPHSPALPRAGPPYAQR